MNIERIKEIQEETAYPNSVSVQQALLKVWNECKQEGQLKKCNLQNVMVSGCPKCNSFHIITHQINGISVCKICGHEWVNEP